MRNVSPGFGLDGAAGPEESIESGLMLVQELDWRACTACGLDLDGRTDEMRTDDLGGLIR